MVAVVCLFFFLCSLSFPVITAEALQEPDIRIKHKPIPYFIPGKRIQLEAKISDPAGVHLARCYFRAAEVADYVFVTMTAKTSEHYQGILPAPSQNTTALEYLFLVVNEDNQVVKTQVFRVEAEDDDDPPAWQELGSEGQINVGAEVAPSGPQQLAGFSDSIAMDLVESSARFGIVAGLYTATQVSASGGATGSAAAATNAGTVSASTGLSAGAMIGIGVGVAVVAGGAAVAAGSSGGDDGGGGGSSPSTTAPPSENVCYEYRGTYRGSFVEEYCDNESYSGTWSMTLREDCTATIRSSDNPPVETTLKFEDNNYTTQTSDPVCGTVSYEGTMQNNSTMGSYTYQEGGSGSYSGDRS